MPSRKSKERQVAIQKAKGKEEVLVAGKKKAIWRGFITFGLVSVPASIYSASAEKPISFNMLCKTCNSPLRYKRWCDKCKKEVPWQDVQKGYRLAKNEYVVVTKEDLDKIAIGTRDIKVLEFVSGFNLEPVYFEKSYYLLPDKGGEHAFYLLLNAMEDLGRSAIGKIVLRNKEDLILIRPYKNAFLLTVLHYPQEIVDVQEIAPRKEPEAIRFTSEEEKLAKNLVEAMTTDMNLAKYRNEYRKALEEVIRAKAGGKAVVKPPPKAKQVKTLIEALRKSVGEKRK